MGFEPVLPVKAPRSRNFQKTLGTDGSDIAGKHPREPLLNPY